MGRDLKLFFQYVTPSMAGMLIAGIYSIVDTFFVGIALHEPGLAAVTLTWPITMLVFAFGDMIGTGAAIIIAQKRGAGDNSAADHAFSGMIGLELAAGILLPLAVIPCTKPLLTALGATPELLPGAFAYTAIFIGGGLFPMLTSGLLAAVRNDGHPMLAMLLVSTGLISNIILDFLLVWVFPFGLAGASLATIIAQAVPLALTLRYFQKGKSQVRFHIGSIFPKFDLLRRTFINGIPTFGGQMSIGLMILFHNWQALKYGALPALAAYTVICTVESIGSMLSTGLATGVQPVASFFYGAHKHRRNLRIGFYGLLFSFLLGIAMMIVSFVACRFIPWTLGLSGEAAEIASRALKISAPAFLALGMVRVGSLFFQSTGKIFAASVLIYGDTCFILPLCLFVLPLFFGLDGVWAAMPVSRLILFLILAAFWRCYYHAPARQPEKEYAG